MQNCIGHGGLIWWEGVVESRQDPLKMNRVQVRIQGWHPTQKESTTENDGEAIDTVDLPWALVAMPTTSQGMHGIGESIHGLVEGTYVIGYFRDGSEGQQPVVTGVILGITEQVEGTQIDAANYSESGKTRIENIGFFDPRTEDELRDAPRPLKSLDSMEEADSAVHYPHDQTAEFEGRKGSFIGEPDTHRLARGRPDKTPQLHRNSDIQSVAVRGIDSVIIPGKEVAEGIALFEPPSGYKAQYPYNKVTETESGHILELDDTPGHERISTMHRTGSSQEYHKNGDMYEKSMGDKFTRVKGDAEYIAEGHYRLYVDGTYQIQIGGGGQTIQVKDNNVSIVGTDVHVVQNSGLTLESHGKLSAYGAEGIDLVTPQTISMVSNKTTIETETDTTIIAGGAASVFAPNVEITSSVLSINTASMSLAVGQFITTGYNGIGQISGVFDASVDITFSRDISRTFTSSVSDKYTSYEIEADAINTSAALYNVSGDAGAITVGPNVLHNHS